MLDGKFHVYLRRIKRDTEATKLAGKHPARGVKITDIVG